jgi:proline dehydrogenase
VEYEISKARTYSRPIAIKMVRGAYMVEESRLAKENSTENPICPSYQDTSNNYNENLQRLLNFRVDLYTKVLKPFYK